MRVGLFAQKSWYQDLPNEYIVYLGKWLFTKLFFPIDEEM
jgi:hypothetical protein